MAPTCPPPLPTLMITLAVLYTEVGNVIGPIYLKRKGSHNYLRSC